MIKATSKHKTKTKSAYADSDDESDQEDCFYISNYDLEAGEDEAGGLKEEEEEEEETVSWATVQTIDMSQFKYHHYKELVSTNGQHIDNTCAILI